MLVTQLHDLLMPCCVESLCIQLKKKSFKRASDGKWDYYAITGKLTEPEKEERDATET